MEIILFIFKNEKDKNNYQKELKELINVYNIIAFHKTLSNFKIKLPKQKKYHPFSNITGQSSIKLKDLKLDILLYPIGVIIKNQEFMITKLNPLFELKLSQYLDWNCEILVSSNFLTSEHQIESV